MNFRSKFEEKFYLEYKESIIGYESDRINYKLIHSYTPDFKIADNVFLETKGLFQSADRTKMREVIKQNPDFIVAIVFQTPHKLLYAGAKSTYSEWCEKIGIQWFDYKDKVGINRFISKYKV